MKNIKKFFVLVVAIAILAPAFVFGATIRTGDEVSINQAGGILDNLYVAGGNISVSSSVDGDLLGMGGNILIAGDVSEDILVAGGTVTILGNSAGDVRIAGGNVLVAGNVAGELVVTGGSVIISPDVSIGKNVVIAGGQILINGNIAGDAQLIGGTATINGYIQGNVKAKVKERLTIGDGAVIDGNLEYSARSSDTLTISENALIAGETVFNRDGGAGANETKYVIFAALGAFVFFKFIALIIAALILIWLFRKCSNSVVEGVVQNPLRMLAYGFATLVLAPAVAIVLLVTLFGAPLGLIIILAYGLLILFACIYAGVVTGAWVSQVMRKSDRPEITWKNVIGGVLLLIIAGFIPLIGWIIALFVFLVTLGSITDMTYRKLREER